MKPPCQLARGILAGFMALGGLTALLSQPALGLPLKPVTYQVAAGDSLYRIAKQYGTTVTALQTVNSLQNEWIVPGEVFIIPGQNRGVYVVQSGDSLYAIARSYQVALADLMAENKLQSPLLLPGQTLIIPEKQAQVAANQSISAYLAQNGQDSLPGLQIVVHKDSHKLALYQDQTLLKSYAVSLGDSGPAPKQVAGDHKTPEGFFYIVQKQQLDPVDPFLGSRWMRIGYPDLNDAVRGLQQGYINQSEYQAIGKAFAQQTTPPQTTGLGGGVGIHGGSGGTNTGDWTWGCIGLADADIEDFYDYVPLGTGVIIVK